MFIRNSHDRVVFPPFQLDLSAGRLCCGSKPINLPPKAFSVLKYLAERSGKLVSKEELIQMNWPNVHVGSEVLKVAIAEIRKVLEDPPRASRFIETAHRRGYRFIAKTEFLRTPVQDHSFPGSGQSITTSIPTTHYARNGDTNIAFQVVGDGPIDLVFVMGWVSHLEYFWAEPSFARFLRRLSSFSRLILFDKRGCGLSDRVAPFALPTLEERMDDLRAVMDAAGSKRATLCGVSEGGVMSALFAATYPKRTAALVLIGSYAKRIRDASYPWGPSHTERQIFLDQIRDQWGGPVGIEERAPSMASDPQFRDWWSAYLRNSASPAAAATLTRMNSEADIRKVLPEIQAPTLVIHRTGDKCLRVEEGRYLASRIPSARFVELPGVDHLPFVGDQDAILNEMEAFLTRFSDPPASEPVVATVLSASFKLQRGEGTAGSHAWHRLQRHINRELGRNGGRDYQNRGRDLLASFDKPASAIHCATAIASHSAALGMEMMAGLHAGDCETSGNSIQGITVERARQIQQEARPLEILVSATLRDLVTEAGIRFQPRIVLASGLEKLALFSVDQEFLQTPAKFARTGFEIGLTTICAGALL
jgi:pimeloyl-ACP methyl ester carboxylesterase